MNKIKVTNTAAREVILGLRAIQDSLVWNASKRDRAAVAKVCLAIYNNGMHGAENVIELDGSAIFDASDCSLSLAGIAKQIIDEYSLDAEVV